MFVFLLEVALGLSEFFISRITIFQISFSDNVIVSDAGFAVVDSVLGTSTAITLFCKELPAYGFLVVESRETTRFCSPYAF